MDYQLKIYHNSVSRKYYSTSVCPPCVDASCRKRPHKKIATEYDVQYTGHQQLNELGRVNNIPANPSTKHFLGYFFVTSAYPDQLTIFLFIKTFD